MKIPTESQFAGCLIGQCLGDAAGFIVEGEPPNVCLRYVNEYLRPLKTKDRSRGRFSFGQYSDDSQLARELLQSFVACGTFDPADYASHIAAIFREERIVGRGLATEQAANRLIRGVGWESAGTPPPSAGNGTAMRAGPVGLLYFDNPQTLIQASNDQSRITHMDIRCTAGAIAIAGAVALVIGDGALELSGLTSKLSEWVRPFDEMLADGLDHMPGWVQLPAEQAVEYISKIGLDPNFVDGWEGISPFVTGSVLWSIYSFLKAPDDYWEAICIAIAVGGDVDTTAAMTGAISGARVGLEGIPSSQTRCLNDNGTWKYNDLVDLARKAYTLKMTDSNRS